MLTFCAEEPDLEYVMINATIIRAHACSTGYKKQNPEGLGRSKDGFTSKIHARVDDLGNPLKFVVTAGQRNDITQADLLLQGITNAHAIANKGYDSTKLRLKITEQNCISVIPPRTNRKKQYEYDEYLYEEKHAIECLFSKMKYSRKVFYHFDKSIRNFPAFLSFIGAYIWLC